MKKCALPGYLHTSNRPDLDARLQSVKCPRLAFLASSHTPLPKPGSQFFMAEARYVTMLREPLDRSVSGYLHHLHQSRKVFRAWLTQHSYLHDYCVNQIEIVRDQQEKKDFIALNNFTQNCEDSKTSNRISQCLVPLYINYTVGMQTKFLLGINSEEAFSPRRDDADKAIRVLQSFAFVGITEDWARSVCLFHYEWGGKADPSETLNTNPSRATKNCSAFVRSVAARAHSRIYDPDVEVYHAAKESFEMRWLRSQLDSRKCLQDFGVKLPLKGVKTPPPGA